MGCRKAVTVGRPAWAGATALGGMCVVLASLLLSSCGDEGRAARVAQADEPEVRTLGAGTRLDIALTDDLGYRWSRRGGTWTARVAEDVKTTTGGIAIPAGSMVSGRVVEISPGRSRGRASFTIAVDSITIDGAGYPLAVSIDSVENRHRGEAVAALTAVRNGLGAGEGGAILGRVLGENSRGALVGPEVDTVARAADFVLPAGTHLHLTLRHRFTTAAP